VIIFCESCNKNHKFTQGEIERILRTLLGTLSDAVVDANAGEKSYFDNMEPDEIVDAICWGSLLRQSYDQEAYQEFVDAGIESRKAFEPNAQEGE